MNNVVLSTRNIDDFITDIANEVVRRLDLWGAKDPTEFFNEGKKLLGVKEAAELLHLKVQTIYTRVSNDDIPYHKMGKRLYFDHDELIEYVKRGGQNGSDDAVQYLKGRRQ